MVKPECFYARSDEEWEVWKDMIGQRGQGKCSKTGET